MINPIVYGSTSIKLFSLCLKAFIPYREKLVIELIKVEYINFIFLECLLKPFSLANQFSEDFAPLAFSNLP